MMDKLPQAFLARMEQLLGAEYADFLASYEEPRYYGLRVNRLKVQSAEGLADCLPWLTEPVPWCPEGLYYGEEARPGKHPYYHAGLYYIQEPSAMLPAELLDVRPGERVLDLCAAPGGKTVQIAGKLQGQGLLMANDNHPDRVKALLRNLELAGVRNALVFNETPERLAEAFPRFFDKVLVDAPCSGEGMFRKDEDMVKAWAGHSVERCSAMQRDILDQAAELVAPGGILVYSTCTFALEENEAMIAAFLESHPAFEGVPVELRHGLSSGLAVDGGGSGARTGGDAGAGSPLPYAVRLWPHRVRGEGHFAAVLRRRPSSGLPGDRLEQPLPGNRRAVVGGVSAQEAGKTVPAAPKGNRRGGQGSGPVRSAARQGRETVPPEGPPDSAERAAWEAFCRETLAGPPPDGRLHRYGDKLYLVPPEAPFPIPSGLRLVRQGLLLGQLRNRRFAPSHALAMALSRESAGRSVCFGSESEEIVRYLRGETLAVAADQLRLAPGFEAKGYCLVCVDGWTAGWGKWLDGRLRNEYPPAWRWLG